MDLDDLIKQKYHRKTSHHDHDEHHYRGPHDRNEHYDDHGFRQGDHHGHFKWELIRSTIAALPHKKALLIGALIIGVVLIILGIALLWAIFPLITQAIGYVDANGIKGILDSVLPYVDKLWKGNG